MTAEKRNHPKPARICELTHTSRKMRAEFPDDAACLAYLWRHLYSADGAHAECPKCQKERKFHRVTSRPSYSCNSCGHHIHPTAGTIFHKSSTSLTLWFYAIFLMSSTRCSVSAKQLEREIGVTYKTAWRMMHLIRNLPLDDGQPLREAINDDTPLFKSMLAGVRVGLPSVTPGRVPGSDSL
jgi:transposase-like protein